MVIERGEYWNIFPYAEIVINQTVKGDLNFRVFESMMCGSMLLTEGAGNGLEELFRPGEHLVTYEKGNVDQAAALISEYLADPQRCRRIAAQGRAEVVAKHLPAHRAATVMQRLETLTKRNSDLRYFGMATNYSMVASLYRTIAPEVALLAQVQTMRCFELGLRRQERMTYELSCHATLTLTRLEQQLGDRTGADLLRRLMHAYPHEVLFRFAAIRDHLNYGELEKASELTTVFSGSTPEAMFATAEKIMTELLALQKSR